MKNELIFTQRSRSAVQRLKQIASGLLFACTATLSWVSSVQAVPAQSPLFLAAAAKPHVSLVMSVDNELFKKAYSDYADLDGSTLTMDDTTYRDSFNYYGYFDSNYCYTYDATAADEFEYFKADSLATGTYKHQCNGSGTNSSTETGAWSGNFLNWMTMTRIDIIRRVLFGGKRSVDTATQTILERAYIPADIHAFVKIYAGSDIDKYTPYKYDSSAGKQGWSFCNVSTAVNGYPVVRIAEGKFRDWAIHESTESLQCFNRTGGNLPTSATEVTVKVEVCKSTKEGPTSTRCRRYENSGSPVYKPSGLLQKYGEDGSIKFSLVTGSYKANLHGGVLRKAAGLLGGNTTASNDEINTTTGAFNNIDGIIKNVSNFRVATYNYGTKYYDDCNTWSIKVSEVKAGTDAGRRCSDWGNPLAEIYLEALRYISGKTTPTSAFNVNDSTAGSGSSANFPGISGLSNASWGTDPWPADQWCAKCSAIVISTGAMSFDGDELASDLNNDINTAALVNGFTDEVGAQEAGGSFAGNYFMGGVNRVCESNSLSKLSLFVGICPELPALEGTYNIAGLAYYAHITDLRTDLQNGPDGKSKQTITTYAVDLAENVPTFKIPVGQNTVSFIPSCESNTAGGATDATTSPEWLSCTLIDVNVESLTYSGSNLVAGSFLFFWEDSSWGSDYDLDASQRVQFCVGSACSPAIAADKIKISNTVPSAQAGNALRFSYSIYGVSTADGNFNIAPVATASGAFGGGMLKPWTLRPGNQNYNLGNAIPNTVGNSTIMFTSSATGAASVLKKPLYYAAKYGGFKDTNSNNKPDLTAEWDNYLGVADGVPDNFFSVRNPSLLEDSLKNVFESIVRGTASASAVATSSTRLDQDDFVYQAIFDSRAWSGELRAYKTDITGALPATPTLRTTDIGAMPTSATGRSIYTYFSDDTVGFTNSNSTSKTTVSFAWANLHSTQQAKLQISGETNTDMAVKRADWLRGNATDEEPSAVVASAASSGSSSSVSGTYLRRRNTEDSNGTPYRNILGDIVNSAPAYRGGYDFQYNLLPAGQGGSSYQSFLIAKRALTPQLYVGSNDGMLHAFSASTLAETFAYIPNLVFSNLWKLTQPNYGSPSNQHQYFVDGPIAVGDVYIGSQWKSIVVGSLGAGGRGIYALDVTNPSSPTVLFEYTNASLGYVTGKFFIMPLANGRWGVILGNGSGSGTNSKLFIVDIEAPFTNTVIIDTGAGSGLSAPAVLLDGTQVVSSVYAGDLSGNIWKFDLSNASASNWTSAYYKVFSAVDSGGTAQPITAAPTIGYNDILAKNMVYVGTGKYFDVGDGTPSTSRQSLYAIPDLGSGSTPLTRAGMLQKTMTTDYTAKTRTISTTNPDWSTKKGWYIDLDNNSSTKLDERVTNKALLIQDKLIVTTLIPSQASCEAGGKSWVMEVPAVGDKYVNSHVLDKPIYADELFLGDQSAVFLGNGKKTTGSSGAVSSGASSSAAGNCGAGGKSKLSLIDSGTSGEKPKAVDASMESCLMGRQSWRQLR